jgi:hypothetical protein
VVAWIGWDLISDAVGNVAGRSRVTLHTFARGRVSSRRCSSPRASHGAPSNPDVGSGERATLPACRPVNLPAFGIVMLITWLLMRGARESRRQHAMVIIKWPCSRCSSASA